MSTKDTYNLLRANPPLRENGERHKGNGAYSAYWVGYDGHRCRYVRTSHAEAAWRAGRDAAKEAQS